eukprot:TRINITY_DN33374_c0_g1_i4.p2 TRINITY_DN33374_c0_g1~~TRINITY_DN33374_c0_g1_i4.p2  ORF type:complete len:126 (-),score=0.19 TRINITY_DN33374_c0_g1_i4:322-699(-)
MDTTTSSKLRLAAEGLCTGECEADRTEDALEKCVQVPPRRHISSQTKPKAPSSQTWQASNLCDLRSAQYKMKSPTISVASQLRPETCSCRLQSLVMKIGLRRRVSSSNFTKRRRQQQSHRNGIQA